MPPGIEYVLGALAVLLGYGRHLLATIRRRATAPNFSCIAVGFGTANLSFICAHLNRGILRAIALERVLRARARTGRDLVALRRPSWMEEPQEPQAAAAAAEAGDTAPAEPRPARPRGKPRSAAQDDPELYMPTLEELERQIRRRSIGSTLIDICLDFAVIPEFCLGGFWFHLSHAIAQYSRTDVIPLMREQFRRRDAFRKEQEYKIDASWDWATLARETVHQTLGFFIGEPPVDPFAAAQATGPP